VNTIPQQDALSSRWTLEGTIPLAGVADGAVWHRARSVATGEGVTLFIVRGEAAPEAADAVRRAYLVEDPHLLPVQEIVVLDESDDGPTTIVEYPLPPAPPLAALLSSGPLHPETARSIIGEAATGLEVARRRGVRHQFLDSNRLFVDTRSGAVVVLGVGVEAAAHVGLDRSREAASFQDTAALVALLYRALTGRSPQHDATGTVPKPSTIVDTEIPQDLDLLCDLVLNEAADDVPETTRELIAELEPWQSIPVTLEAYPRATSRHRAAESESTVEPTTAESEPTDPSEDDTVVRPSESPDESSSAGAAVGLAGAAGAAGVVGAAATRPSSEQAAPDPADVAVEDPDGVPAGAPQDDPSADPQGAAANASSPEDAARTSSEARAIVEDLRLAEKRGSSPFPGHLDVSPSAAPAPSSADDASDQQVGAAGGLASATGRPLTPTTGDGDHLSAPSLPPQDSSSRDLFNGARTPHGHDQVSAPTPASPERPEDEDSSSAPVAIPGRTESRAPTTGTQPIVVRGRSRSDLEVAAATSAAAPIASSRSSLLRDVVSVAVDSDDPDTYALGPRQPEERSRQSQWIIAGAVLLTIIAAVFAITTATSGLRDRMADPLQTASAEPSPTETGEAPVEPTPEKTEEPKLPAPEVAGAELFTQGGGEPDHTDQIDRLTDGDPGTFWSTQHYASPDFGGIKDGVGMRVSFAEKSTVKAITVTTARNNGGTLELRSVKGDGTLGDVLATGEFVGDGEVRLEPEKPVDASQVALYIPDLPPDSNENGRYRARIAEITAE
jgi:hypothetical protein